MRVLLALRRGGRRLPAALWRGLLGALFLVGVLFLGVRHLAVPQIAAHRGELEALLTREIGQTVRIAALDAQWTGLRPEISLRGLRVIDAGGRTALELPGVDVELAWASLWHLAPRLSRLEIHRPELDIRREADGRLVVAGIPVAGGDTGGGGLRDFVLEQDTILIHDGRLTWTDLTRDATPLRLDKVGLRIENSGSRHRVALLASPSPAYSSRLDLRADLHGESLADLAAWRGTVYLSLDEADLAVWQTWADYPLQLPRGRGGLRAWLDFAGHDITALTADVALANVSLRLGDEAPQLDLAALQGRIGLNLQKGVLQARAERLTLATTDGARIGPTRFTLSYAPASGKSAARGEFSTGTQDLQVLARLAAFLPLPGNARAQLDTLAPEGRIEEIAFQWEASAPGETPARSVAKFSVKADLRDLTLHPVGAIPGARGLSGEFSGNEKAGRFSAAIAEGGLYLPAEMHEPFLPLDRARLRGSWTHETPAGETAAALTIRLDSAEVANPHITARASGYWQARANGPGYLDLRADAAQVPLAEAWRYLPLAAPTAVVDWMRRELRGGRGENLRFQLTGDLDHFPFHRSPGVFRLETRLRDAEIAEFSHGWPGFQNLQGSLLIDRQRLAIRAETGRYGRAVARDVLVEVPDMMSEDHHQVLTVAGKASGPNPDFLRYVNASAIHDMATSFLRGVSLPQGSGALDLKLTIPLHDGQHTQVAGSYAFQAPTLRLTSALPEFTAVNATLGFTERGVSLPSASAQFLGRRVSATGVTEADGSLRFDAQGVLTVAGLRQLVASPGWNFLSGETPVGVAIRVRDGLLDVSAESALTGIASSLPAPFAKVMAERWPLRFALQQSHQGEGTQTTWRVALPTRADVRWREDCPPGDASCRFVAGAVGVGEDAPLPAQGWQVRANLPEFDVERWQPVLHAFQTDTGSAAPAVVPAPATAGPATPVATAVPLPDVNVAFRLGRLTAAGYRLRELAGSARLHDEVWSARVSGPDLAGELDWRGEGHGRLRARLTRLVLVAAEAPVAAAPAATSQEGSDTRPPDMDVVAEQFEVRGLQLGRLTLQADNDGDVWRARRIELKAPDMDLTASGAWRETGAQAGTQVDFRLHSDNAGAMLARLGFPDTLRRGEVDFSGNAGWPGPPTAFAVSRLGGKLDLEASNGQFQAMEPGVGRLLGVLSLQSLPRRITLDFRDVFSAGFAFDRISGKLDVAQGVLATSDLEVRGPAARVFITGRTDLGREMHDLHIKVQPTLSESVAVGVVVGQAAVGVLNPVVGAVGAATYLAQKLLRDPVEKIFSYEYTMRGSWSDPKVEKIGGLLRLPENSGASGAAMPPAANVSSPLENP
ncbi:MAG: YhdP family protein [Candidatus Dactylopiibacterium sp.]|nr:YhdP family protein [Candidatus Dactylopiibacterium sp.]